MKSLMIEIQKTYNIRIVKVFQVTQVLERVDTITISERKIWNDKKTVSAWARYFMVGCKKHF